MIIDEVFKVKKIKVTNQRKQIYSYLLNEKGKMMKEIINDNSGINPSTIYRIIELFEDKKIITKISRLHEIYYLINCNDHKHYIECIECHRLTEIDVCPYTLIDLKGYKVNDNEIIKGICEKCQHNDKKIGIFVGSFNPITKAHLEIGKILYNQKIIDEIVYVPCNSIKKDDLIDIHYRHQMILKTIFEYDYMNVNDIEIRNGKNNFSYQELDLLKKEYSENLYVILGADNLLNLDKWDNYKYLLENYNFIVITRFKVDIFDVIKEKYSNFADKFNIVSYENDLSSTLVRNKLKNNEDVKDLINDNILSYIKENKLYKG